MNRSRMTRQGRKVQKDAWSLDASRGPRCFVSENEAPGNNEYVGDWTGFLSRVWYGILLGILISSRVVLTAVFWMVFAAVRLGPSVQFSPRLVGGSLRCTNYMQPDAATCLTIYKDLFFGDIKLGHQILLQCCQIRTFIFHQVCRKPQNPKQQPLQCTKRGKGMAMRRNRNTVLRRNSARKHFAISQ
jgi:hypothetical protein